MQCTGNPFPLVSWVLYLISFTPVSGGRAWSLVTAKVDFNGTVLKQNNFSAYCYILGWFLRSENVSDQRMVTKRYWDSRIWWKILMEKKWPFLSCLFRVCISCSVWGFSYFVCKKFLSTKKLILNTKIAVADDSDWSELKHFFSCILFALCVYKQAVLFVYDLCCISEI